VRVQPNGRCLRALCANRGWGVRYAIPGLALLVKKICAKSDLTAQVVKQVAHVQLFVHADIAAVIKLAGVNIPALDKPLGQHQGWPGEFGIWKVQTFALDHRRASIARLGDARQAEARLRAIITPGRQLQRPRPDHLPLVRVTRTPVITELCGYTETVRQLRTTDCGGVGSNS
jgi:hypothetical protein